jgi:hypothetical protein
MTLYDSSVLIGSLDGNSTAVEYVEKHVDERAGTTPLAMFAVYRGEGSADEEYENWRPNRLE